MILCRALKVWFTTHFMSGMLLVLHNTGVSLEVFHILPVAVLQNKPSKLLALQSRKILWTLCLAAIAFKFFLLFYQ